MNEHMKQVRDLEGWDIQSSANSIIITAWSTLQSAKAWAGNQKPYPAKHKTSTRHDSESRAGGCHLLVNKVSGSRNLQ